MPEIPTFTASKWTPLEVSLVNVAADPAARIRSEPLDLRDTAALSPGSGALGERERISRIVNASRTLNLPDALAQRFVDQGIGADAAIAAMFEQASERQQATRILGISSGFSGDDPEHRRNCMADALASRISRTPPPEHARDWAHASLMDLARACLEMRGVRAPRSATEVFTRVAGLHTTSDFAILLQDAQNKSLRQVYQSAPSGVRPAARQTSASDFRDIHRLAAGNFPTPFKVLEHAEYTRGSFTESDERYSLATYGRIFGISRQAIINDDLGVFEGINRSAGIASAEFVASELANQVVSNPAMFGDGTAIFHVNHGNLRSVSATIDVASVSAARVAMRAQKDIDGRNFLNASPRYLIVPPSLETAAEQFVASIAATTTDEVNPFSGRLAVLVDPRLPTTAWYLAADPGQVDGLEFAFLDGNEGPQIETRIGFDIDGVERKLRLDFGAGWVDFRWWQKTPTA